MLPMIFRKVDLSLEKLIQWTRKWTDVSISLPQLQIGLSESWKLCLNLRSRRWLKPNLNLVNNLTPLGLWQLKTVLPEGRMKFKSVLLKIFKLSESRIKILKEIMLYFEQTNIISISCVVCTHRSGNNIE